MSVQKKCSQLKRTDRNRRATYAGWWNDSPCASVQHLAARAVKSSNALEAAPLSRLDI
jgi:hypothetical protein